ncbi:hypothetical protein LINGRAHAP2_LOCUS2032, partial [Linum grandiflorum]
SSLPKSKSKSKSDAFFSPESSSLPNLHFSRTPIHRKRLSPQKIEQWRHLQVPTQAEVPSLWLLVLQHSVLE